MTTATLTPTSGARPVADTLTMLRRNLLRAARYPGLTSFTVGIPIALLLLFVFVFGGAFGAGVAPGVAPGADGRAAYLDYITPAILLFAVVGAAQSVAITAAMDATSGIMARFKTMAISPASVLGGPVLGTVVQGLVAVLVVLALALALGFRPGAGPLDWLALAGFLTLVTFATSWLCVAMGLAAKSVETASNTPMLLTALPFLGSGFVPVETMPSAVRWFAEYQPFTPVIETTRALLAGSGPDASTTLLALGWSAVIGVLGYVWARALYRRERR
ncbi:ABC transporter permease [Cellulomonas cellasea]|uniref:Transport permease protein n=1 Tax=Cellulomonas cellasea TaxID=43670 RepID=A0A7W4UFJ2_9CELL|nr:ABC transporter permease [Cellulomonas cellasea]MBB2922653.1 ABC-2 type transport system permease protein [Cellulomonas cellasea]